jgi:alginate O-acetyltransferase complex protein AlgI
MNFASGTFFVFIAIFFIVWPWARKENDRRWTVITIASLVFYGWFDWRFIFLLVGSAVIDFVAASKIEKESHRKKWLIVSIIGNLGALATFKYADFGVLQINSASSLLGYEPMALPGFVLPIGISFYTFQSMSYTIDVYRRQMKTADNFWHFFSYLSMFPQLVAGPIVRAKELLPQLATPGKYSAEGRESGLRRMALGFFQKVVIADNCAPIVNELFQQDLTDQGAAAWIASALFGIQIYADFAGYSNIAIGIAKWCGYQFPDNFRHPYLASGFKDFWGRWHITLSTWFRDYVYIPLGGSRKGESRGIINAMFTMTVSGLWHGANMTFIMWGAFHGTCLCVERLLGNRIKLPQTIFVKLLQRVLFLLLVVFGWMIFRAENMAQVGIMGESMLFHPFGGDVSINSVLIINMCVALIGFFLIECAAIWRTITATRPYAGSWLARLAIITAIFCSVFLRGPGDDFIYFQF